MPNFPFVYYYFVAFTIVSAGLLVAGLIEMLMGVRL